MGCNRYRIFLLPESMTCNKQSGWIITHTKSSCFLKVIDGLVIVESFILKCLCYSKENMKLSLFGIKKNLLRHLGVVSAIVYFFSVLTSKTFLTY